MNFIDLTTFETNDDFYGSLDIIITVKSFELQAIRKRYLESKKNARVGSVERREPSQGGLVSMRLNAGCIDQDEVLVRVREPRGIAYRNGRLAFASENQIIIVHADGTHFQLNNEWFSYVHTVEFSPFEEDRILVSSSGFDCFFEYRYPQNQCIKEWFAWEHGFDQGHDQAGNPVYITRNEMQRSRWEVEGKQINFIANPATDHLPTSQRSAFVNSVYYDPGNQGNYIATLFHKGEVIRISDNGMLNLFSGLKSPHGGRIIGDHKFVVNTAGGTIIRDDSVYAFHNLPGKPAEMAQLEWLQNAIFIGELIVVIDSNRTSFMVLDLARKYKSIIPFNCDYAVQDLVAGELTPEQKKILSTIA
ncbi:MAG: hypothetical protein KDC28_12270 [Saprospiraceae bacterium]|nr:hypothetical protein [Saprospiraceae bacterium]MCB9320349.1 hypothetical protein [Lewinellaceae bacterium]